MSGASSSSTLLLGEINNLFFCSAPACAVTQPQQWNTAVKEVDDFLSGAVFGSVITHRDNEYLFNDFFRKPHQGFPLSLRNCALETRDARDSYSYELHFFQNKSVGQGCLLPGGTRVMGLCKEVLTGWVLGSWS